jgi:predicted Zn-dependent peptidase
MFAGRNMIVAVAGDFDPATTTKTLASAFGSVPAGEAYQWKAAPAPAAATGTRIAIVDKARCYVNAVPDRYTGHRAHEPRSGAALGGEHDFRRPLSRPSERRLRVNTGLTYGASSRLDQDRLPGRITIASFTRTETTGKAVDVALQLMKRLHEKGITADQLSSAKQYLKGTYPASRLETPINSCRFSPKSSFTVSIAAKWTTFFAHRCSHDGARKRGDQEVLRRRKAYVPAAGECCAVRIGDEEVCA